MKLDLKQIAHQPGATLPFELEMDLSALEWNGEQPVPQPVHVEGRVRNMAGALLMNAGVNMTEIAAWAYMSDKLYFHTV